MNWERLLSLKRFGDTEHRQRKHQDETRLGFDVDYDRIIFSQEFRSLQDKTQVVPLSKTGFAHTRLTHSLEVSVVGRSLGRQVGKHLLKKYPLLRDELGYQFNDFGAIVAAASLAHDIGNPPFGHSGEKAIGKYFEEGEGVKFKSILTATQYEDLCKFEGNANGFKILTQKKQGKPSGLRLSYATLGAFIKYPKASLPYKPTAHISDKKFGFFQTEKDMFLDVVNELGLITKSEHHINYYRHPLAYLVEAADDICYTIIDFEDGINLGFIDEEYALEYLIKLVKDNLIHENYYNLQTTQDRISYLRALAINTLVEEAVSIFMNHEEAILKGDFSTSLLEKSRFKAQIEDVIQISVQKIYNSKEVLEKELAGYEILSQLLNTFGKLALNVFDNNLNSYDKLLLKILPDSVELGSTSVYNNIMEICLFISKLSDTNAAQLHKKIKGDIL